MNEHNDTQDSRFDNNERPSAVRRRAALAAVAIVAAVASLAGCEETVEGGEETNSSEQTVQCGAAELFLVVHDNCSAMDATAVPDAHGDCWCHLGFAWDGSECVALGNCACSGADCDKLTETQAECEAEHAQCTASPQGISCGDTKLYSIVHDMCEPMDAAGAPDEYGDCLCMLGFAWNGSACTMIGNCQCVGDDCDKLAETQEQCEAEHAACS